MDEGSSQSRHVLVEALGLLDPHFGQDIAAARVSSIGNCMDDLGVVGYQLMAFFPDMAEKYNLLLEKTTSANERAREAEQLAKNVEEKADDVERWCRDAKGEYRRMENNIDKFPKEKEQLTKDLLESHDAFAQQQLVLDTLRGEFDTQGCHLGTAFAALDKAEADKAATEAAHAKQMDEYVIECLISTTKSPPSSMPKVALASPWCYQIPTSWPLPTTTHLLLVIMHLLPAHPWLLLTYQPRSAPPLLRQPTLRHVS